MKKLWFMAVGFVGLIPLQGCVASVADEEQTGSTSEAVVTCTSNQGLLPTKAALAVAMARELGRWDAVHDLALSNNVTVLSSSAVCTSNSCKQTKALLGLADPQVNTFVDQNTFNATTYGMDVNASFNRQNDKINDLTRNNPGALPPAHKLTKVAGPTDLGMGACGAHFVFQADHLDGTPLSTTEATNLANSLCFFSYGSCGGGNPFLAFVVTGQNCPSGRTCVAIDPTGSDSGSTSTTTSGSAPTYSGNRLWDPNGTMIGTACTLTTGPLGTLKSRCPISCGYDFCVAN